MGHVCMWHYLSRQTCINIYIYIYIPLQLIETAWNVHLVGIQVQQYAFALYTNHMYTNQPIKLFHVESSLQLYTPATYVYIIYLFNIYVYILYIYITHGQHDCCVPSLWHQTCSFVFILYKCTVQILSIIGDRKPSIWQYITKAHSWQKCQLVQHPEQQSELKLWNALNLVMKCWKARFTMHN